MNGDDHGSIIVITGPMFSGKSTELRRILKRYEIARKEFILFKPAKDDRYSDTEVVTHDGLSQPATVIPVDESCRSIILNASKGVSIVGFDEVQFWEKSADLPGIIRELALQDKTIYATLLNLDFTGKPFLSAGDLINHANRVISLTAVCRKCGSDNAVYSQRIDQNGSPVLTGETIKVGGEGEYSPRCRKCFLDPSTVLLKRGDSASAALTVLSAKAKGKELSV